MKEEAHVLDRLVAESGLTVTTLTPEQAAEWQGKVADVVEEWAADLDRLGRPGTEVVEAFRAAP